jgi:hypothetical protein
MSSFFFVYLFIYLFSESFHGKEFHARGLSLYYIYRHFLVIEYYMIAEMMYNPPDGKMRFFPLENHHFVLLLLLSIEN